MKGDGGQCCRPQFSRHATLRPRLHFNHACSLPSECRNPIFDLDSIEMCNEATRMA